MSEFIFPWIENEIFQLWRVIDKFSDIQIKPNTLVLCDIDDTLLHHPAINNTWVDIVQHFFFLRRQTVYGEYNPVKSIEDANKYCDELFESIPMRHTDREGFFAMVGTATEFAFVTARHESARSFTYDNLQSLGIDPGTYTTHFSGSMPKGEYIRANFDLSKYDYVVFIDDQVRNLQNVLAEINHSGLELYQFRRTVEESHFEYYPFPPGFNPNYRFDGTELHLCEISLDDDDDALFVKSDTEN